MIPVFLLLAGLGLMWVSKANREQALLKSRPSTTIGAADTPSSLLTLRRVLKKTRNPPRWLVNDAMREAFENGDIHVVGALATAFQTQSETKAPEASEETPAESDSTPPQAPIVSPIASAKDEEWSEFLQAMKTESPEFKTEKHLGAYRQNVERLNALGIDPGTDPHAQAAALSTDLADYATRQLSLIRDACGDVIIVNGQPINVTMSGVLGLLKAAGPSGARSWLKSEAERASFPKTTETFLRTNGIF